MNNILDDRRIVETQILCVTGQSAEFLGKEMAFVLLVPILLLYSL